MDKIQKPSNADYRFVIWNTERSIAASQIIMNIHTE
jgi:hypothetical protein